MANGRNVVARGILGGTMLLVVSHTALAAADCVMAGSSGDTGAALLGKYVAAINAHDTSSFPELFSEILYPALRPKPIRPRRPNREFPQGLRRDAGPPDAGG